MTWFALGALAVALVLDHRVGEPPERLHPVVGFGRLVDRIDRRWEVDVTGSNDGRRKPLLVGLAVAILLPLSAGAGIALLVSGFVAMHPLAGAFAAGLVLFSTCSLRRLLEYASEVVAASEVDPATARDRLPGLVGRDPTDLDGEGVRSGAIESAAENLSDGFLATLLPFALLAPLSLPAAAGVAAWVKAVNTLDSMLGYPEKSIGTASARLDDLVMILPSRITAVVLAVATCQPGAVVRARADARVPASPNAGWPMATLAEILDARLEKPGAYVLNERGRPPSVADGERAVRLVGLSGAVGVVLAATLSTVVGLLAREDAPWTAIGLPPGVFG